MKNKRAPKWLDFIIVIIFVIGVYQLAVLFDLIKPVLFITLVLLINNGVKQVRKQQEEEDGL